MNKELKKQILLSNYFSTVEKETIKKYSKKTIQEFERLLQEEDEKELLLLLIINRINFGDFGLNISELSSIMPSIKAEDKEEFLKLPFLKEYFKFIKKEIFKNKEFYQTLIEKQVKNKTRQKGAAHFVKKAKDYFSKYINVVVLENSDDLKELKDNTIYLSNSDALLIALLKENGIKNVPKKGIDIVVNFNGNLSFGEVKEINESGGAQNHQFKNMEDIASHENGFGLIYGNILFGNSKMKREIEANPNIYTIWEFEEIIQSL